MVLVLALAAVGATVWGVSRARARKRLQVDLARARTDLEAGRSAIARRLLMDLSKQWPRQGEVLYLLGQSELAAGRSDDARETWTRIRQGDPHYSQAAEALATLDINTGHFGRAETILEAALADPSVQGQQRYNLERALSRVYRFEGRVDDVRRVLRASYERSPDRPALLKELWLLDNSPFPVEALDAVLTRVGEDEDDRVWLARGNLATMTGHFDEAARWLAQCEKARSDDPAVWRAWLRLARASGDPALARRATEHMPAERFTRTEVQALRAWLTSLGDDPKRERQELETLRKLDPGNTEALDRLAALALEAGRKDEVERLRERKTVLDEAKDRYRKLLLDGSELASHAEEFARLAGTLGREFDAAAWSRIAKPGQHKVAETKGEPAPARPGQSLADLLADAFPTGERSAPASAGTSQAPELAARIGFKDAAESAGLKFRFDNGATSLHQLPETMSGGVAVLDYDGDGWLDVFAVQGGPIEENSGSPREPDRLFRNRGDGTFEDVSEAAGITALPRGYGLGVTVGDVNNDGRPDLFLTRLRSYLLLLNRGDGTFEDVTESWGLAGRRDNPTSAAFADLDGDGDLDLYVCHYMLYDPDDPRLCLNDKGEYFYCDPSKVDPAPDHLFRNDGDRFVDVTESAGIVDPDGRGLGVVVVDLDDDGRLDLYIANDGTANYLFHNLGGLRFEEIGHLAGVAGNAEGGYQAGMGVACGDLDGDGLPDLGVTNFYGEGTIFYHNLGGGLFADHSAVVGLAVATRYRLGFGLAFVDLDNDGRLDVVQVNGHVNDNRPYYPYAMPAQVFRGLGDGRLAEVPAEEGDPLAALHVGRGLADADLDNDGRVDLLILSQNEPLAYLDNGTEKARHFVTFRLEGTASGRDAVGARLLLRAGGRELVRWRAGGGSYQSSGDPRMHVGLGDATRVESVEVHWPSGRVDRFEDLPADTGYLLREGEPTAHPLPGFPGS